MIQWRKFEFKRSYIFKDMDFLNFLVFFEFFLFLFLFKMAKRGFLFSTELAELTWHSEPARMRHGTQGHVAEPREPTRCLGGTEEARTRGRGHTSPRGRPGGAT